MKSTMEVPWQLQAFSQGLKKNKKLRLLQKHLRDASGLRCLLVTCGDNNGALNYHFREAGGIWTWADIAEHGVAAVREMEEFLGETVHAVEPDALPFPDASFDCVVAIDVHEHLKEPQPFTGELFRVVRPGGRAIVTVPNGDQWKPANVIKYLIGMTKEQYGHMRIGYNLKDLKELLSSVGFRPHATGSYSKFFTEMMELIVNFAYVKVLSKKGNGVQPEEGTIAPSSQAELKAVSGAYSLYSRLYPTMRVISQLDRLVPFGTGYAVLVEAERP